MNPLKNSFSFTRLHIHVIHIHSTNIGMIHAGIGERHLNGLLTTIGLPGISKTALKVLERHVGPEIEELARRSCASASQAEYDIARSIQELDIGEEEDVELSLDEALQLLDDESGLTYFL